MLKQRIRDRFRRTHVGNLWQRYLIRKTYGEWLRKGKPAPVPHRVKQMVVKSFAEQYQVRGFVETGTYLGDMVWAVKNDFENVYSVELSKELYEKARKMFSGYNHITIVQGDSSKVKPSPNIR